MAKAAKEKRSIEATVSEQRVVSFEVENTYWDDIKELAHAILDYPEGIPDSATCELRDGSIEVTWFV